MLQSRAVDENGNVHPTQRFHRAVRPVGSYWPYATTLFDYVRRAMPTNAPMSLSNEEVYTVSAYVLFLNGIIGENQVMNARTLPAVKMPNCDGFVDYPRK